jgi:FeS assembly SUF system regulator
MVRISKLTDYAVLVMSHLASMPDAVISAQGLADDLKLPMPTVSKILKSLTQSELLTSQRGPSGGYRISRAPERISLMEIIAALEGPLALTECSGNNSECAIEAECGVRNQWISINQFFYDLLSQIDLVQLNQGKPMKNYALFKGCNQ